MNDESERPVVKRHRGLQNSFGEGTELDNKDKSGDDCQEEDRTNTWPSPNKKRIHTRTT